MFSRTKWLPASVLGTFTMEDVSEGNRACAPDPSHRQGSQHRRWEPLGGRKHRVPCDSERPNMTFTQQFRCHLQSSAITAFQVTVQLHRPRPQSTTWMQPLQCDLHAWIVLHDEGRVRAKPRVRRTRRTDKSFRMTTGGTSSTPLHRLMNENFGSSRMRCSIRLTFETTGGDRVAAWLSPTKLHAAD